MTLVTGFGRLGPPAIQHDKGVQVRQAQVASDLDGGKRRDVGQSVERFAVAQQAKHDKAAECVLKDREDLLACCNYPAEHWRHPCMTKSGG